MINAFTIPAALFLVLAISAAGAFASDPKTKTVAYKRQQSREDIAKCGYGSISYVDNWCIQWSYHAARR